MAIIIVATLLYRLINFLQLAMARLGWLPPTNLKIWLGSLKAREALQIEPSHSELELLREVRAFFFQTLPIYS